MKRPEIRIYVSEDFYEFIALKAKKMGLSVTMYAKYLLIQDTKMSLDELYRHKKISED